MISIEDWAGPGGGAAGWVWPGLGVEKRSMMFAVFDCWDGGLVVPGAGDEVAEPPRISASRSVFD